MSVVLYRYDTSPFSHKIDHVLLLKNIPHEKVNVSNMLPRPEITDLLGVRYRLMPLLAIGNDIYCDTGLITSALERRFPASQGYGTIFPNRKQGGGVDTGLITVFTRYWIESVVFFLGVWILDWEKFPPAFVKDRESEKQILGKPIDMEAIAAGRGRNVSILSTQLSLIEEQLSDGREWIFDTEQPSLADISVHFILAYLKRIPAAESLFDPATCPKSLEWFAGMTGHLDHLKQSQPPVSQVTGEEAAARIAAASFEPYSVVGFDVCEGDRLGLKAGDEVSVGRDDSGPDFGTVGKLVTLNKEEFVIETKKPIRCHFPRIGFTATLMSQSK
ncbi:hypothetical protein B0H19DRAFT_1377580 [Mycena capillaripes]|nr:hypothetical protein B0H19DRAFT_1377580 [Mycena capillaripes]